MIYHFLSPVLIYDYIGVQQKMANSIRARKLQNLPRTTGSTKNIVCIVFFRTFLILLEGKRPCIVNAAGN